jgi:hypothetical protein
MSNMALKYNVGDKVLIKSLDWYNENKDENGSIDLNYDFTFYASRSKYCGKVFTIAEVFSDCYGVKDDNNKYNEYYWIDEMIECKVEEEIKPKFKVGDILFYRGETSGYLKVEEIRVENGEIRYYETSRNVYLLENDPDVFADKVCSVETEETGSENKLLDDYEELTDRAFKGGYEKCKSDIELNGFQLPEGYIFKDDNGNEILTNKIILEKKKKEVTYPKTYEECCKIIDSDPKFYVDTHLYSGTLETLYKLLICRDAYWKIAGAEMGLGKPWEPDWREERYIIYRNQDDIIGGYREAGDVEHHIFEFPTSEMRYAFEDNFDQDLEICKTLL